MTFNPPNPGTFFNSISAALVDVRNSLAAVNVLNNDLSQMAGAASQTPSAFLQAAPYNLSAVDANGLVAALGNNVNIYTAYNGGAAAPVLNYVLNSAPFTNGQ